MIRFEILGGLKLSAWVWVEPCELCLPCLAVTWGELATCKYFFILICRQMRQICCVEIHNGWNTFHSLLHWKITLVMTSVNYLCNTTALLNLARCGPHVFIQWEFTMLRICNAVKYLVSLYASIQFRAVLWMLPIDTQLSFHNNPEESHLSRYVNFCWKVTCLRTLFIIICHQLDFCRDSWGFNSLNPTD